MLGDADVAGGRGAIDRRSGAMLVGGAKRRRIKPWRKPFCRLHKDDLRLDGMFARPLGGGSPLPIGSTNLRPRPFVPEHAVIIAVPANGDAGSF